MRSGTIQSKMYLEAYLLSIPAQKYLLAVNRIRSFQLWSANISRGSPKHEVDCAIFMHSAHYSLRHINTEIKTKLIFIIYSSHLNSRNTVINIGSGK